MKMDSSIFTKMLKYISQNVELENQYFLEILGTSMYKDLTFCDSVLYLAGIDNISHPEVEWERDGVCVRQQDEWTVYVTTRLSVNDDVHQMLEESNSSLNVLVVIGHDAERSETRVNGVDIVEISYKDLALLIDETCSDMTIELHQFLVENYLINQLEPG